MALTAEERKYWEDKGFVEGAKVRITGPSWHQSPSARNLPGAVGYIVSNGRKSKGFPVLTYTPGAMWENTFVYHPTNLELIETPKSTKEPKMPEPKMPEPKETKSPLYTAVRDILEAKDRETLDARTDAKVSAVLGLLGDEFAFVRDPQAVNITNIATPAPATPWNLDGLVIDPGKEAVGQWGFFWDKTEEESGIFGQLSDVSDGSYQYSALGCGDYTHFAYLPNFPGAALLKATSGYEAP